MPPTSPSATVQTEPPRTVTFDYARLEAIELALDKGVLQIVQEQMAMRPPDVTPGERPTTEQAEEALKRLRFGFASRFVAACLDITVEQLAAIIPPRQLPWEYFALAAGFARAMNQLSGEDPEPGPQEPRPAADG